MVRHFETIEDLRLALLDFAAWYNTHWLVARHGHRTPAQVRGDQQQPMNSGRMIVADACLITVAQYIPLPHEYPRRAVVA